MCQAYTGSEIAGQAQSRRLLVSSGETSTRLLLLMPVESHGDMESHGDTPLLDSTILLAFSYPPKKCCVPMLPP